MSAVKRVRREPAEAKLLILRTAEKIMLEEGYAAVTIRRVAKSAGVSATLLHYYYSTADDLLVALYRHGAARDLEILERALAADDSVAGLWSYLTDPNRTALGVEFLALANHRKPIRNEISRFAQYARGLQVKALSRALKGAGADRAACPPLCMSVLLTSISRNLIMEHGVGISLGHAEARAYVERQLRRLPRLRRPGS